MTTHTTTHTHTHHCAECGEQVDAAGCSDHPEAGIDSVRTTTSTITTALDNGGEGDALVALVVADAPTGPAAHLRDNAGLTLIDTWSGEGTAGACSYAAACAALGCTPAELRVAVVAAYPEAAGWDWACDTESSTAAVVARELGDDGARWRTDAGEDFAGLLARYGGQPTHVRSGAERWEFPDSSAIIAAPGGWDVGRPGHYSACTCWPSESGEDCNCGAADE